MVDVVLSERLAIAAGAGDGSKVLDRLRLERCRIPPSTRAAAIGVLLLLSGVIVSLILGSIPALKAFGFSFLLVESWNPVTEIFGALPAIYGTIRHLVHRHADRGAGRLDDRVLPHRTVPAMLRRPIGIAIELLAGIPSIIYGIWGLFVFAPFLQQTLQPFLIDTLGNVPGSGRCSPARPTASACSPSG